MKYVCLGYFDEARAFGPMQLHRQLIDTREHFVRRCQQRLPLRAFDVHLDDQPLVAVSILRNLIGERVEQVPFNRRRRVADALVMKHGAASLAGRAIRREAVVLMNGDLGLAR